MRRPAALVLVGALAALLLSEVVVWAVHGALPDPAPWPTNETRVKAGQMARLGENGGASVAFVGSSVSEAAIDTERLTRESGVVHYNAATPFATQDSMVLWLESFVLPELRPTTVVIGLPMWSPAFVERTDRVDLLTRGLGAVLAYRNPDTWIEATSQTSYLLRYRGELKTVLDLIKMEKRPEDAGLWSGFGSMTGYHDRHVDHRVREFVADPLEDVDLSPLAGAVDRLTASGIEVVLLFEPSECDPSGECLDPATEYLVSAAYRRFAAEHGVASIDGRRDWPADLYADSAHFNAAGTASFTDFLQQELHRLGL